MECERGREIELNGLPGGCWHESDGSLDPNTGREIITPMSSGRILSLYVEECCSIALNAGYSGNSRNCGLHIHVAPTDMNSDVLFFRRMFNTAFVLEPVVYALMPESRRSNDYARWLRHDFDSMMDGDTCPILQWYGQADYHTGAHDSTRYRGFNLHALTSYGTVELRHHSGSLNHEKIRYWIKLGQYLVNYASNEYDHEALVRIETQASNVVEKFWLMVGELGVDEDTAQFYFERLKKFADGSVEEIFEATEERGPMEFEDYAARLNLARASGGGQSPPGQPAPTIGQHSSPDNPGRASSQTTSQTFTSDTHDSRDDLSIIELLTSNEVPPGLISGGDS